MIAALALGVAFLLPPPSLPQGGEGGVEGLIARLAERTAERRRAAAELWKENGPAYLASPGQETLAPLLAAAPEIQAPALAALDALLGPPGATVQGAQPDPDSPTSIRALLDLLRQVMDPAGADRLLARRPRLPPAFRRDALLAALARHSAAAARVAEAELPLADPETRAALLLGLCHYGDPTHAPQWLAAIPLVDSDQEALGTALLTLAQRPGLPKDFRLPKDYFQQRSPGLAAGILALLAQRPDDRSEAFVSDLAGDPTGEKDLRHAALQVAERSTPLFRWRRLPHDLAEHLKKEPDDPLAEDLAWTLHRLGQREGTRFLLAPKLAEVKRNPKDYRSHFALGRRYVDLSNFREGYREYQTAIRAIEHTSAYSRIPRSTWLYAARAACGSRHYSDGSDWLRNARMSPRELAPYRELPEFKGALTRPVFKRLFGIND